jgi:hypothetical protein
MMPIGSVAFVKGWTRIFAAHVVAHLLITLELVATIKESHAVLFESLCCIYANVVALTTEHERIDANRGTVNTAPLQIVFSWTCV